MLQLKDGVLLAGNKYTNAILLAVQTVYRRHEWPVTVTSGRDSHDTGYHPLDRALDIRHRMIEKWKRDAIAEEIRAKLPAYYDVINEIDHYHIEADAKKEGVK